MKMKLRIALLSLAATTTTAQAQQQDNSNEDSSITIISGTGVTAAEIPPNTSSTINVPNYSEEQCAQWLQGAFESDSDLSNGLSENEFHSFLLGIEEPPYVKEYFSRFQDNGFESMPWIFKVVHKTLACRCEDLGLGDGCCKGDDPEVPFIGLRQEGGESGQLLTEAQRAVATEYKADMCNSIAVVFQKFIPTPQPSLSPVTESPTTGSPITGSPSASPTTASPVTASPSASPVTGSPVTESPTISPTYEDALVNSNNFSTPEPTLAPIVAPISVAYECTDATKCNENDPSKNEEVSGWTSLGLCGGGNEIEVCPPTHDGNSVYGAEDQVSVNESSLQTLVEIDVVGSTLDYTSFDYDEIMSVDDSFRIKSFEALPGFYNAEDVMNNKDFVLRHVLDGFGKLATTVMMNSGGNGGDDSSGDNIFDGDGITAPGKRNLLRGSGSDVIDVSRALQIKTMGVLDPVQVTDIECPSGLMYAPQGGACLNFKFTVHPDDQDQDGVNNMFSALKNAINNEGRLYDDVMELHPDTPISGLGNPGKGIDLSLTIEESEGEERATPGAVIQAEEDDSGLPIFAIILIILAIIAIPVALIAMYAKRKRAEDKERMARLAQYEESKRDLEAAGQGAPYEMNDHDNGNADPSNPPAYDAEPYLGAVPEEEEPSSEPSLWSDSESESDFVEHVDYNKAEAEAGTRGSAGSALAAMGAAGIAASLTPGANNSGSDESYDSRANVKAEVRTLVRETGAPRSANELLSAYAGNEEVLLDHLRTMKAKQETESNNRGFTPVAATAAAMAVPVAVASTPVDSRAAMRAEVVQLVEDTKVPRSADQLLTAYAGREEVLVKHLRMTRDKQQADAAEMAEHVRSMREQQRGGPPAPPEASSSDNEVDTSLTTSGSDEEESDDEPTPVVAPDLLSAPMPMSSAPAVAPAPQAEPDVVMPSAAAAAAVVDSHSAAALASASVLANDEGEFDTSSSSSYSSRDSTDDEHQDLMQVAQAAPDLLSSPVNPSADELAAANVMISDDEEDEPAAVVAPDLLSAPMPRSSTPPGTIDPELLNRMASRKDIQASQADAIGASGRSTRSKVGDEWVRKMSERQQQQAPRSLTPPSPADRRQSAIVAAARNSIYADEAMQDPASGIDRELLAQISKRSVFKQVENLVEETNPGKSAAELLGAFQGREDDLIESLTALKASQNKRSNSTGIV